MKLAALKPESIAAQYIEAMKGLLLIIKKLWIICSYKQFIFNFQIGDKNKKSSSDTEMEDPGLVAMARSHQAIYIENHEKSNKLFSSTLLKKVSSLGWIILCGGQKIIP